MNRSLWQRVQPHAIAIAIFFIVSCAYCLPAFKGFVVAQHDVEGWKGMAQESIEFKEQHGYYPLWTNSMFSGMPAFQIALESRHNLTLAWLHHLFIMFLPSPAGLFFLACLGFYILCGALKIRNRIGILASLAYGFASYNAVIVAVGHTTKFSSMGYAPAVIAGIILLTQRRYLLGFIVTLVFSTQLFFQNHIQIVYYTLLIAVCIAVAFAVRCIRNKEGAHLVRSLGLALLAGVIGLLSFAVMLFPTYDYARETLRGGRSELTKPGDEKDKTKGGLDKSYAFGYSYGITEVLTIAVPRLYGGSSGEMPAGSKTAEVLVEKTGMGEEQADQFAQQLPAYWGPQGGTSGAVYFGAIVCLLFIFGIVYYAGWHRWWIIAASLLGIMLAWGKHFPAFNYFLFDYLPFYNKFRAPSMAMVIPQLTFPLLAALGLNAFLDRKADAVLFWKKFRQAAIGTGIVVGILAIMYFMLDYRSETDNVLRDNLSNSMAQQMSAQGPASEQAMQQAQDFGRSVVNALKDDRQSLYGSDLVRSIIFIALALGLMYMLGKQKLSSQIAISALTILVFIDLIGVDLRYLSTRNYVDAEQFEGAFTPTPADTEVLKDTSYYRVFNSDGDPFQLSGSTARTSYLHNSVGGYHPAKLALYHDLIFEQLVKGNLAVFNMLNTKYFIVPEGQGQQGVRPNPNALGPAWFVNAVKYVNNANEEMRSLDNFSPADTVIIDKREQAKVIYAPQPDSSATITFVENMNDRISYRSSSATNGFAVFSEIYYPHGWKAFIDGKEAPIARVNYALRGLAIPAGQHQIEFRFEPASYFVGDKISLFAGILSLLVLLYGGYILWKKNRNGQVSATAG